jgi:glycosyltransferase involved in cell wall biosynthesis
MDLREFNRLSEEIRSRLGSLSRAEEEAWMHSQGPWCPGLFSYLEANRDRYDAFLFFTYLYATTYFGLPIVADRAFLVPTAHDEWPIYLGIFERVFDLPRAFFFNTHEEREFLRRRFPRARLDGSVVGLPVDPPRRLDPALFRSAHGVTGRFVLYLGRIDAAKGIPQLLEYFRRYQLTTGDFETELVLAGKSVIEVPCASGVRAVGFVADEHKWSALAGCEALVMPSEFESLSLACMEAWSAGKPSLVNAHCAVLLGQTRRSQGGLWYRNPDEFGEALSLLVHDPELAARLGAQGRAFVSAHYQWEHILSAYRRAIEGVSG